MFSLACSGNPGRLAQDTTRSHTRPSVEEEWLEPLGQHSPRGAGGGPRVSQRAAPERMSRGLHADCIQGLGDRRSLASVC